VRARSTIPVVAHSRLWTSSESDPRAEELGQLKLALATFALHLEAFEMRTHEVLLSVSKSGNDAPLDNGRGSGKDDVIGDQ